MRRRFIEQDDVGPGHERARNGQARTLSAAEEGPARADPGVQAVLKPGQHRAESDGVEGSPHLLVPVGHHGAAGSTLRTVRTGGSWLRPRQEKVAADGRVEQVCLLRAPGGASAQVQVAAGRRQEPQDRGQQGRLAGAGGAGDGQPAPGAGLGRESAEDIAAARPRGSEVHEFDPWPAAGPRSHGHQSARCGAAVRVTVRPRLQDSCLADPPHHGAERRVLPHGRRDGRVGVHQGQLHEDDDGDRRRFDRAAQGERGGQHGAGQGGAGAGQDGQGLAETLPPMPTAGRLPSRPGPPG